MKIKFYNQDAKKASPDDAKCRFFASYRVFLKHIPVSETFFYIYARNKKK